MIFLHYFYFCKSRLCPNSVYINWHILVCQGMLTVNYHAVQSNYVMLLNTPISTNVSMMKLYIVKITLKTIYQNTLIHNDFYNDFGISSKTPVLVWRRGHDWTIWNYILMCTHGDSTLAGLCACKKFSFDFRPTAFATFWCNIVHTLFWIKEMKIKTPKLSCPLAPKTVSKI